MAERIRFHLDEHMDPDIASAGQGRVMVTDDIDFLIAASKSFEHPGIVFCRRTSHTLGEIIRFLILLHEVYTPAEMRGRVEYPF